MLKKPYCDKNEGMHRMIRSGGGGGGRGSVVRPRIWDTKRQRATDKRIKDNR